MRLVLAIVLALVLAPVAQAQQKAQQEPEIAAPGAIVVEASSGDVIFEKAADEPRPMASTTKLMTALVTLEQADLEAIVTTPRYDGLPAESVAGFAQGEKVKVADLLRALLVESANDAAVALAQHVAGSVPAFVRMMNRRAEQLGLENTSYANPVGLDEAGNYSTPRDLATLTLKLRKDAFFRQTVASRSVTLESGARPRTLDTSNDLMAATPWVDGVKTGNTTQAGDVLVASGHKPGKPRIVSVVMGAADEGARDAESLELLEYGTRQYKVATAVEAGTRSKSIAIPIEDRPGALLPVDYGRTVRRVRRKDEDFRFRVDVPEEVTGPIEAGERIGEARIYLRGEQVAKVPMVAAIDVPKAGFARRAQDFVSSPWTLVVLGGVLVLAALVTQRRGPSGRRQESPA